MKRAIELAWEGIGRNSPNPMVGCVIVNNGEIVGEGFHLYEKVTHAEIIALEQAGDKGKNAILYVTIEPCSHEGRTPPCVGKIADAGISKVVYGMKDPYPLVNGKGHEYLVKAGIEVESGMLEDEIRDQNKFFLSAQEKDRPYVLAKWAMSADGKIATHTGDSRGISSKESLRVAHHLRNTYDAILVGHNTVLTDNPSLTCRLDENAEIAPKELVTRCRKDTRNPVRIILDTFAATPGNNLNIFKQEGKTYIIAGGESVWEDPRSRMGSEEENFEILDCPLDAGKLDIHAMLKVLVGRGINSVMVEGGGEIHAAFLEAGLVNEVAVIMAPKIIGGRHAPSAVAGQGFGKVEESLQLKDVKYVEVGPDVWMSGKIM